ncbi:hypothetical protein ACROYT_G042672 [Oculina patagonica]
MKNFNLDAFLADASSTPWDTAFVYDDLDDIWAHWSKLYNDTIEKHAPTIKKTVRTNHLPWINAQIKGAMRLRNKLYAKYRRFRTDDSWERYRLQRNLVSKLKRNAIKRFCSDSAANATTPGGFWMKMKPFLPRTGQDTSQQDIHLMDNGKVIMEPSNFFNAFFSNPILDQAVLGITQDGFRGHSSVSSILANDFNLDFSFSTVSSSYIETLLGKIKSNKSCGPDNIMPKILKLSAPSLASPLSKLLNHCIRTSTWPAQWKLSNVTPVFKKDDASLVSNYRPIIKMIDDWRLALDSKKVTGSIAIDLSKAFDSICHNLLLAKLSAYGVGDAATKFLHSYLSERKQRVKVNGIFSDWLPVYCGVPQGSLLGPLLFNIFINDLNFVVQVSSLRLYADDTTTYASDSNTTALELSLNQDLDKLSSWFSSNYLIN